MDYFGINSAEELPKIKEVITEQVDPTIMNPQLGTSEIIVEETLVVTDNGELIINEDQAETGEE